MDNELYVSLMYCLISRFDKELNKEVAIKVIDLEESYAWCPPFTIFYECFSSWNCCIGRPY